MRSPRTPAAGVRSWHARISNAPPRLVPSVGELRNERNESARSHRSSYRQAIRFGKPSSAVFLTFPTPETV